MIYGTNSASYGTSRIFSTMHCTSCGKKNTKNRTIDPVSKECSECQSESTEVTPQIDDDATMSNIKFSEFKVWMKAELNPIIEDIKSLRESVQEIEKQKRQIELLKARVEEHEDTIDALKNVVAIQQRSLRAQDSDVREKNLIISGISESDIVDNGQTYNSDEEKIGGLFRTIGVILPEGYTLERLGKPNDRYSRSIKLNVISKANRDSAITKAKDLKDAAEPWNMVYINYDQHPAVVEENKRLRKKKKMLKSLEENKDKEIKIEKGELKVDGIVVDSNILFR